MKKDTNIEWEEDADGGGGSFTSQCGLFSVELDSIYGYFRLFRTKDTTESIGESRDLKGITIIANEFRALDQGAYDLKVEDDPMNEPEYIFDKATSQLFFQMGETRTIIGDIDIALAWTTDEDGNGCLHKHGPESFVSERAALIRTVDETVQVLTVPWEAISHPEMGPLVLEEINNCLNISGYVSKLEGDLAEISERFEIEIFPRDAEVSAGMEV